MGRWARHIATVPQRSEAVTEKDGRNRYGVPGIPSRTTLHAKKRRFPLHLSRRTSTIRPCLRNEGALRDAAEPSVRRWEVLGETVGWLAGYAVFRERNTTM